MCRSLKFMVEKLIKAGHLKRYNREIDHGVESGQATVPISNGQVEASNKTLLTALRKRLH